MSPSVKELVAIGAAIACNCEMCFKFHFDKASQLGVTKEDMLLAVETGQMVKSSSAKSIAELAQKHLNPSKQGSKLHDQSCCGCQ